MALVSLQSTRKENSFFAIKIQIYCHGFKIIRAGVYLGGRQRQRKNEREFSNPFYSNHSSSDISVQKNIFINVLTIKSLNWGTAIFVVY